MALPPSTRGLVPIHPALFRAFSWIARRRLRGAFSALRIAHLERFPKTEGPLIVYLNHPSWWDPLTGIVLAPHLFGQRSFYAPIEAESLKRYAIFRRLGLFPVEIDSPRGAAQFLRAAEAVLASGHVLGVTPQGRFADVRARPPGLKAGLGALLTRMEAACRPCTVVPLALEYTFWNERTPEALACVGEPLVLTGQGLPGTRSARDWTAQLEQALTATQEELAALAIQRDRSRFQTLLEGRSSVSGVYGLWQRLTLRPAKSNPG